ncbi:homoserine kinase [Alteromonas sp. CYL-A6]|uniref:homoserine kinase n=1 Tax=Alteromonas nitratireducens TaxID=3390813 RepID=UPI0034B09087
MKTTRAYAPASVGNVGLGFDVLGAALAPVDGSLLGDEVSVTDAPDYSLDVTGRFAHKLPAGENNNIVTRCYAHFMSHLEKSGRTGSPVAMTLSKNLPIGSGLGSSASSIVAAFHALNQHFDSPFDDRALLLMMGELEGQISGSIHYDNVAPCFLGGITLMTGEARISVSLPVIEEWRVVVCYSGISVSTAEARNILPASYAMADTLTFGRQLAVFVHALHSGQTDLATAMVNDVIAEPWRKSLLPEFDNVREQCMKDGATAFGISGSGPTVFAICTDDDSARAVARTMTSHYIQNQDGFTHICRIPAEGAVLRPE